MRNAIGISFAIAAAAVGCNHAPSGPGVVSDIEFSRRPCYGFCPVYSAQIKPDGTVQYSGDRFCTLLGQHTGHIPTTEFARLERMIKDQRLISYKDRYEAPMTDQATVVTRFTIDGTRKSIQDYGKAAPDTIRTFEGAVESVLQQTKWDDGTTTRPGEPLKHLPTHR